MPRSLVATLLSGVFALQLLLGGAGAACVMPSGSASAGDVTANVAAMAGMDMRASPAGDRAPTRNRGSAPCDQPASLATCQGMAPCASAFLIVSPPRGDARVALAAVPALTVLAPPSRATAPELPPPRA